jgi:hypothetical protein
MFKKPERSYMLGWSDDSRPNLGEGISRTSKTTAPLWRVDVADKGHQVMRTTIRAANKAEALKFSQNRYPSATTITVIGKANANTPTA